MRSSASPLAVWSGILVLYVVWGSTYLGMKLAIDTLPPFVMGFLRFVPAGLLLCAGVLLHARGAIARPTRLQVRDASIVGAMLLLGGTGLVAWGQQTIPTGIAALLIGLVPDVAGDLRPGAVRRSRSGARRRRHRRRPRRRGDPRLAHGRRGRRLTPPVCWR